MNIREKKTERGPYRRYERGDLTEAYKAVVDEGFAVERAAKLYQVPITTLKDRVKGRINIDTTRSGRETVLSHDQEALLSNYLKTMAEVGYGYSRQEVLNLSSDYAVHVGARDKEHPLGYEWFYGFMSRWPELKVTKPRSLEVCRARSATSSAIENYFKELKKILDKYNLTDKPNFIYNIDEKGLSSEHKPPKIIAGKTYKAQAVTSGKGKNVTLIGCVNAAGQQIPPYFVFPGKRMLDTLMEGATVGAAGSVSDSGWSNSEIFETYMKDHLLHYLPCRNDTHVLVLYDGHRSHVTLTLIQWAIEQRIILFVLPPHCSHILQPLDVSCYGPLELAWNSVCHKHIQETGGKVITRYDVCKLACKAYTSTLTASNIQAAFRKSGIFPYNPNIINQIATAPASAFPKASNVCIEKESSAENFLESRGGKILQNVNRTKIRNTLSKVVGGKAITEEAVVEAVKTHLDSQKPKQKVESETPSKKSKKSKKSSEVPVPGPSGIKRKRSETTKKPIYVDSCDSDESDIEETDKCVICKRFSPNGLKEKPDLLFVKWGNCDKCERWVHLSFCSPVKILRRGDPFSCPLCA